MKILSPQEDRPEDLGIHDTGLGQLDPDYDTTDVKFVDPTDYEDLEVKGTVDGANRLVDNFDLEVTADELLKSLAVEYLGSTAHLEPKPNSAKNPFGKDGKPILGGSSIQLESEEAVSKVGMYEAFNSVLGEEMADYITGIKSEMPGEIEAEVPEDVDLDEEGYDEALRTLAKGAVGLLTVGALGTFAGCTALGGGGDTTSSPTSSPADTTQNTVVNDGGTVTETSTLTGTATPTSSPVDSDGDNLTDAREEELGLNPGKKDSNGDNISDLQVVENNLSTGNLSDDFVEVYNSLESEELRSDLLDEVNGSADREVFKYISEAPPGVLDEVVKQYLEAEDTETVESNIKLFEHYTDEEIIKALSHGLDNPDYDNDTLPNNREYRARNPFGDSDNDLIGDKLEKQLGSKTAQTNTERMRQIHELGLEITEDNLKLFRDDDNDQIIKAVEDRLNTSDNDRNSDGDLLNDRTEYHETRTDPGKKSMVIGYAYDSSVDGWLKNPENQEYFRQKLKKWGFEEVIYIDTGQISINKSQNIENFYDHMPQPYRDAGFPLIIIDNPGNREIPYYAADDKNVALLSDRTKPYSDEDLSISDQRQLILNELTGTVYNTEFEYGTLNATKEAIDRFMDHYTEEDE